MTCNLNLNKDCLHPTRDNPWVHYVDKDKWKVGIRHFDAPSFTVPSCKVRTPEIYDDLDELCSAEFERRNPGKTPTSKDKLKIAFNACNRNDLECHIRLSDPLKKNLNIQNEENLTTYHLLLKNSPVNGSSYQAKEGQVVIDRGISSSRDRHAKNISMARSIHDHTGKNICYTGRPDSLLKAKQQAEMIFFREMASDRKGITESITPTGQRMYTLTYSVTSVMTLNLLMKWKLGGLVECPERKYVEEEVKALKALKKKAFPLQHPITGELCYIQYRPILFSRQLNFFAQLETVLPDNLSGKSYGKKVTQKGFNQLKRYAKTIIPHKNAQEVALIASLLRTLKKNQALLPEEEILCRDFLCKLLNLPLVYHCKSSTDRTALLVALSSTLNQWLAHGNAIPKHFTHLLQKKPFKELFAANLMAGHQITRISRGGVGKIKGEKKLNPNYLGIVLGCGITQNQAAIRLLPKRYSKPVDTKTLIKHGMLSFLLTFFLGIWKLKSFYKLVPTRKLNESSPLVGKRKLMS